MELRSSCNVFHMISYLIIGLVFHFVYGDPDFHGNEGRGYSHSSYAQAAISYYTWTGIVVGVLIFIILLCVLGGWVYTCRKRELQRLRGENGRSDQPKVFVLHPPSYISHDPPEYSAPDFFEINRKALKEIKNSKQKAVSIDRINTLNSGQRSVTTQNDTSWINSSYANMVAMSSCTCEHEEATSPTLPPPPYVNGDIMHTTAVDQRIGSNGGYINACNTVENTSNEEGISFVRLENTDVSEQIVNANVNQTITDENSITYMENGRNVNSIQAGISRQEETIPNNDEVTAL